jgi:amino acid adenylation domain-containing protein
MSATATVSVPVSTARNLSPMQAGMLAETLLASDGGVNIVQFVIHYPKRVDASALRRAWDLAIQEFPILRTDFAWRDGEPSQSVRESAAAPWEEPPVTLLGGWSEADFQAWLQSDRQRGMALDRAPLMRLALFRMADEDRLVWTFHHLLLDGGSVPIVLQAVEQAYVGGAITRRERADFATFLDWLETRDEQSDRAFWSEYLGGIESATPLFGAKERRDEGAVNANLSVSHVLSRETTATLESVARRFDVTLGTIVQGAWGLLACRQQRVAEALFGVTRSGRHFSTGAEDIVGLLINTVPVRVRAHLDWSVERWLRELRDDTLRIRAHEATALVDIQAASDIPRGEPLFESLVIFEGTSVEQRLAALDDVWKTRNIDIIEQSSFPLVLTVQMHEGLSLEINYDPGVVDGDAVRRTLAQLATLLSSLAASPSAKVGELAWLPKEERERIEAFNAQVLVDGVGETIVDRFQEWARRTPEAEALAAPDGRLTYGELEVRANRLARYLEARGVRRGDSVAICLDRNSQLIVAILAVLKAGAAYLPIDTFYPKERIQAVADGAAFNLMVTLSRLRNSLPNTAAELIFLDQIGPELEQLPKTPLDVEIGPSDPAYVIFTSGTTGKPKGVRTVHGNVMSMYRAWEAAYCLEDKRSHLQLASPSFDVFSGELVRALCGGLKLVMCPYEYSLKPNKMFELMRDEQVDIAEFVPLSLRSLVDYLEQSGQRLEHMRLLAAGADVWYVHEFERVRRFLPEGARLINSYGISETTVDSTYFEGDVSDLPQGAVIPIGRPFGNTAIYVLGDDLERLPIDVVGEIYIGGHGVTPGYLNDPGRTRERFLPDPYGDRPGALMYKSGDLGRLRADGTLELVGRSDHQVKVRGFRIELGEVEAALSAYPQIQQAVASTQARGVGEKRLIGYYVPRAGCEVDPRKLRAYLGDKLPYYMVPAALVRVDAIPRSPNGKVDRGALPPPEDLDVGARAYQPPSDELEARLCQLWSEVLGVSPIGVTDDFFEIGGHSLLAVSLFAKIEARLGKEMPITALFEGRTVQRMADALRGGEQVWSHVVELGGAGDEPPLFWIHTLGGGGGGGFFRYQTLIEELALGRKSYGIRAPAEPFNRMEAMAALYVEEMRRLQPKGPYHLLGYCFGGVVAYTMAEQLHSMGERVAFLGLIEASAPVETPSPLESPRHLWAFSRNVVDWAAGFVGWPTAKKQAWARRQLRSVRQLVRGREHGYTMDDFLDNPERQGDYRKFVEAHWEALMHYEPKSHPCRATLLRVRGNDLRAFEHDLGWGKLCELGVDVELVTGRHGEIFNAPHLQTLANALRRRLSPSPRIGMQEAK